MERLNVVISTDGSCSGNPGPGGWAAKLRFGKNWKEIADYDTHTTNNRMEIIPCIRAIENLKKPCSITLRTDSTNLINCITNLEVRSQNGWKTKTGANVANCDLHQRLYKLIKDNNHEIHCVHVKGHAGDQDNESCDKLAKYVRDKQERVERSGKD